jgi:solute:Na+ symporter, SSS family
MHPLDVVIIVGFAGYAVASGLRARRDASPSLTEYFLAGRTLGGVPAGLSMAATQFAADTPLLVTCLVATAGIFSLWRLWVYALAFLLMGFVLAQSWRRARVITDAELTELRYGGRGALLLRGFKAVYFGLVFNCTVVAMVLFAAREIAEPFLTWDAWLGPERIQGLERLVRAVGVPLASATGTGDVWVRSTNNLVSIAVLLLVTTLYSATGGLRGVVRTDVAQLALMLLGTAVYGYYVVTASGGLDALHGALAERFRGGPPTGLTASEVVAFWPSHAHDAGFVLVAAMGLQWLVQVNADGTGYLAQRSMACRSDHDARVAAVVFTVTQIVLRSLLWLPIALGLLVLFPSDAGVGPGALRAEREATFVLGMKALLPPGALGLMLTAMLAALMSTVDTHLNWGASYVANDLYARLYCRLLRRRTPNDRELVWVARAANLGIVVVALGIMTQLSSIQAAWQMSLLLGAGVGVLLVLRWIWWRITALGEIAALVASAVLAPVLLHATDQEALRLVLMAAGATTAGVIVSLRDASSSRAHLERFYRRARPPGFWGPVADAGHDGAARLRRGLLATFTTAAGVFSLLTAAGSWIAQSDPPAAWPGSRGVFLVALAAAGALLLGVGLTVGLGAGAAHPPEDPDAEGA